MPIVHAVSAGDYLISSNGAVVADLAAGGIVRHATMTADVTQGVIDALATMCPEAAWAADRATDRLLSIAWPPLGLSRAPVTRLVERLPAGPGVLCLMVLGCSGPIGQDLAQRFGVGCTSSGNGLLEFSAHDANKASALDWMLDRAGLPWQSVLAYGDALNDVPMLAAAGKSVAVANACSRALHTANEVTSANDEDGVARHLEALLRVHARRS